MKGHFMCPLSDNIPSFEVWEGRQELQMLNLEVLEDYLFLGGLLERSS